MLLAGLVLRAWPWLAQPLLPYEDGVVFFAQSYAEFDWSTVARPYAGYVPVGSNLQALLVCRLPTTWLPVAFVCSALVMAWGAAATLLRPTWRQVAPFRVRLLMAATLAWLPFGSYLEFTSLAYSQWPQLLWLFLLLGEPEPAQPRRPIAVGLRLPLVAFLSLCNPLGPLLIPVAVWACRGRHGRLDAVVFMVATAAYALIVLAWRAEDVGIAIGAAVGDLAAALASSVLLEGFAGLDGARAVAATGTWCTALVALLMAALLAVLVVKTWRGLPCHARQFIAACAWLALTTVGTSLVLRPGWIGAEEHVVRYAWPARAAVWLVTTLTLATLWRARVAYGCVALLGIGLWLGNAGMHFHPGDDRGLGQFVEELAEAERQLGNRRLVRARWDGGGWVPIIIRPR